MASDDQKDADVVQVRRNKDLFNYLISTFQSLLPAEEAEKFQRLAQQLNDAVRDNCASCQAAACASSPEATRIGVVSGSNYKDPRRQRFLLRLIAARISHLFIGEKAILPKSVAEGLDRYLKKALGDVIYSELNNEAENLLSRLGTDNDKEIWERIFADHDRRRFAETILIRILLKFENFATAKRIFISVVGMAMNEGGKFPLKDGHFHILFEALFTDVWRNLDNEGQRIMWDYQLGEHTSKRLQHIFKAAKADRRQPAVAARP